MKYFEKLFETDILSKRERVERALNCQPVDRVPLHEQLSFNPSVIADYTGKSIQGFEYTLDDICAVIRKTMDMCFPPVAPRGTGRITDEDGFVKQNDNWTTWHISRPFGDVEGARTWLKSRTRKLRESSFNAVKERDQYRADMLDLQRRIGDTVILNYTFTGLCSVYDQMGLELFSYFYVDYPEEMDAYMEASIETELRRVRAVADSALSPAILIAEDFSTKQGPIFSPAFLNRQHYPYVRKIVDAWHSHGIKVIYHSDGNYKKAIPALMDCGVDGFYCLEPNCGMDIVELKKTWPQMVWAGGVDGVDLMEFGTPDEVWAEVSRHIRETKALETGGMFVATSSEINPPIKPGNFRAMVEATGSLQNGNWS
jgi:hypothetical protein